MREIKDLVVMTVDRSDSDSTKKLTEYYFREYEKRKKGGLPSNLGTKSHYESFIANNYNVAKEFIYEDLFEAYDKEFAKPIDFLENNK